jgi:uncharacterized surface protein with fasciclin (FAS1) repeats
LRTISILLVVAVTILAGGCTGLQGDGDLNRTATGTPVDGDLLTIDGILATDGNHSTFARALDASRLERVLAGPGPYTVFVPSEGAFNRLPPGMLDELMEDPKGNLAEILLYHIVPDEYQISGSETIATVQGSPITIDATDDGVTVNGAEMVGGGTPAANGVIYTIDGVLLPPDIVLPAVGDIE